MFMGIEDGDVMKWIDVKDQLPIVETPVIVCNINKNTLDSQSKWEIARLTESMRWDENDNYVEHTYWVDYSCCHNQLNNITHWMYPPEVPIKD